MGVSEEKLLPALPGNLPDDLVVIATACCDFDPHMRPSFVDIAEELEKVVQQMQVGACCSGCVAVGSAAVLCGFWPQDCVLSCLWSCVRTALWQSPAVACMAVGLAIQA